MFLKIVILIIPSFLIVNGSIIGKVGKPVGLNLTKCECAAFPANKASPEVIPSGVSHAKPILHNIPMNVSCPDVSENCKRLCRGLAEVSKDRAPAMICMAVGNVSNFYVSVFAKSCEEEYQYTNITNNDPFCCRDFKVCTEEERKKMVEETKPAEDMKPADEMKPADDTMQGTEAAAATMMAEESSDPNKDSA